MCNTLRYPNENSYKLPEKNVLVLSCIDLRLTDNLLHFLHFDNLTNRYDHFALAGTSLTTQWHQGDNRFKKKLKSSKKGSVEPVDFSHWQKTWWEHLQIAINLHDIKDVYIVEHQCCAAYDTYLTEAAKKQGELPLHTDFAVALMKEIKNKQNALHVHSFYMDLRGNVTLLGSTP